MKIVYDQKGKAVSKSKDLAGVRRYATKHLADSVSIVQLDKHDVLASEGLLHVSFKNGAYFETKFGSYALLRAWVRGWHAVHGARLIVNGNAAGLVNKLNPTLISTKGNK